MNAYPQHVDLASELVGGVVLATNDEFFAAKENLIRAASPIFIPDKYVDTGKWMDGWESRRRRQPGHDWCLIRLGLRGVVREINVDTSHFVGNYPEECSIEVCDVPGLPDVEALLSERTRWTEIVPRSPLAGDKHNRFSLASQHSVTHVLLRIYPDGGVARLRVHGDIRPDWDIIDFSGEISDLAAVRHGGRVVDCSDMFFGSAQNMLMPGRAANMGDGWETRRRRDDGHDWAVIELGSAGHLIRAEVDTTHFKGNAPGACRIETCDLVEPTLEDLRDDGKWTEILSRTKLQPHSRHFFQDELNPVPRATHARLHIYPDGGVARLRLYGRTDRSQRLMLGLGRKNALDSETRERQLRDCCGSRKWASRISELGPYSDITSLMRNSDRIWLGLDRADWLEAFSAHPPIGATQASGWSQSEQSGVTSARPDVLAELRENNRLYEEKFGYIFIVCATGKSAPEMLSILRQRLENSPEDELPIAAEEQRKITRIRLEKWLCQ